MVENIAKYSNNSQNILNSKYIIYDKPVLKEERSSAEITEDNFAAQNNQNKKKSKKTLLATGSLTLAGIITLVGVLTKAPGLNRKAKEILKKSFNNEQNTNILNLTKLKENITLSAKEGLILKLSNFSNNMANFKDCYLLPFLNNFPVLRYFAQKTSKVYIDTGINMTQKAYRRASNNYGLFDRKLNDLMGDFITDEIKTLIQSRNTLLKNSFAAENIPKKAGEIGQIMDNVGENGICIAVRNKFNELIKNIFKKRSVKGFGEFIAEDMVKTQKAEYIDELRRVRDQIMQIDDDIIKQLRPSMDEKALESLTNAKTSAQRALNNAIKTEGNDLFDKIRDVKIGSAPNDILGILSTTGMLGIYLAQAENKDQRVEAALTTGVPLGLGMLSTTYATIKMYTGMKSIIFGIITTFIANNIGKIINNEYKKRHNIKEQKLDIPTLDKTMGDIKDKIKVAHQI